MRLGEREQVAAADGQPAVRGDDRGVGQQRPIDGRGRGIRRHVLTLRLAHPTVEAPQAAAGGRGGPERRERARRRRRRGELVHDR